MASVSLSVNFNISSDPNQAMIDAFCGSFNYQNLIPGVSGLVANPQSSGDFARTLVSGYIIGVIKNYNIVKAATISNNLVTSGVMAIAFSGVPFTI